jgi:hypothetical protein
MCCFLFGSGDQRSMPAAHRREDAWFVADSIHRPQHLRQVIKGLYLFIEGLYLIQTILRAASTHDNKAVLSAGRCAGDLPHQILGNLGPVAQRGIKQAAILAHAPHASGLDAIDRAGLLGARTALVHGNLASKSERARIAQSGASLVHCPGTHAYFRREPFDARAWLRAGVTLALGTDSLASNTDLDMSRELALFAAAHPHVEPAVAFACATRNGARALGFAGRAGELVPGAWADFVLFETGAARGRGVLDAIVHGRVRLAGTWVGGRRAPPAGPI